MNKTIFMENTKINPSQTVGEIQAILGKYGVNGIHFEYDAGEIKAVAFSIVVEKERRLSFVLPCRWEKVHTFLINRLVNSFEDRKEEYIAKAKRIAWRQVLRWVEAQLAFVETDMARVEEVFMPYLVVGKNGQTLYDKVSHNSFLLEAPK